MWQVSIHVPEGSTATDRCVARITACNRELVAVSGHSKYSKKIGVGYLDITAVLPSFKLGT